MADRLDFKIGDRVAYTPYPGATPEPGRVTGIGYNYVFVKYDGDGDTAKATPPEKLEHIDG